MPSDQFVERDLRRDALRAGKRADRYVPLISDVIDSSQMFLDGQVSRVSNVRILTDAAFKRAAGNFSDQLDLHPTAGVGARSDVLRNGVRSDFGDDTEQILIALRNTDKTADLPNLISTPVDDRQTISSTTG